MSWPPGALPARARTNPQAPPKLIGVRHAVALALGLRAAEPPLTVVDHREYPVQRITPGRDRFGSGHACRIAGLQHRQVPELTVDLARDIIQRVLDRQEVPLQDESPLLRRGHAFDAEPPAC